MLQRISPDQADGEHGRWEIVIVSSCIDHPPQLTPERQARVRVTPEMIRLSVGVEHIDDILVDLGQALEKAAN